MLDRLTHWTSDLWCFELFLHFYGQSDIWLDHILMDPFIVVSLCYSGICIHNISPYRPAASGVRLTTYLLFMNLQICKAWLQNRKQYSSILDYITSRLHFMELYILIAVLSILGLWYSWINYTISRVSQMIAVNSPKNICWWHVGLYRTWCLLMYDFCVDK